MKKLIKIGNCTLGSGKIYIQSMTNTQTSDVGATVCQIQRLQNAGCEIVRISVPDEESAKAIAEIKKQISVPIVADIHFDYKLAILSAKYGADKIRINPSNIGSKQKVGEVAAACKDVNIPIRVGINAGSIDKDIEKSYGNTNEALLESAKRCVELLNGFNFDNIVLSAKASDVMQTIAVNRLLHKNFDYPLHIGLTEAGTLKFGFCKSAIAIGSLLCDKIGDTIRVSLSTDPVSEIFLAKQILRAVGIDRNFAEIIACPTCARTTINVEQIAASLEEKLENVKIPLKIAVMGCVVNGIGEGKHADIGLAGGKDKSVIFKKGEKLLTVSNSEAEAVLLEQIEEILNDARN